MMACGSVTFAHSLRRCTALLFGLALLGCLSIPPPKAAEAESTPVPPEHAMLEGFVVELDGEYTRTDGEPIALTPGCHIAKTTADTLVAATDVLQVFWLHVPAVYFRIDAKPGYRYRVERSVQKVDNRYNIMVVVVRTFESSGSIVSTDQIAAGPAGERPKPSCS